MSGANTGGLRFNDLEGSAIGLFHIGTRLKFQNGTMFRFGPPPE